MFFLQVGSNLLKWLNKKAKFKRKKLYGCFNGLHVEMDANINNVDKINLQVPIQ